MITYKLRKWIEDNLKNWLFRLDDNIIYFNSDDESYDSDTDICWSSFCENPNAIDLLEKNLDKINWYSILSNPNVSKILKLYPEKSLSGLRNHIGSQINWNCIDLNSIDLILINKNKIDWEYFSHRLMRELKYDEDSYRFLDQITNYVSWDVISKYTNNINLLESNLDKIEWDFLSENLNAISVLEKNLDKINWTKLSANPNGINILKKNYRKINWKTLSLNLNAMHWIEKNLNKIHWRNLCRNPNAIYILEQNMDKINWDELSKNPNKNKLFKKFPDRIEWSDFSKTSDDIYFLKENLDKIDWFELSKNPIAIKLLEIIEYQNLNKINFDYLLYNPDIFTYDYEQLKLNKIDLHKKLIEYLYHPIRIQKHLDTGIELELYLE